MIRPILKLENLAYIQPWGEFWDGRIMFAVNNGRLYVLKGFVF